MAEEIKKAEQQSQVPSVEEELSAQSNLLQTIEKSSA